MPLRVGKIREARQNAVILFDQIGEQEALILQTDLAADRNVDALLFMPLPAKPKVSTAPPNLFANVERIVEKKGLHFFESYMFGSLGAGPDPEAEDGLRIVLREKMQEHDVTVVEVESLDHFIAWVASYTVTNKMETAFDFGKVRETVSLYLKDNIRFFLFDRVSVKKTGQQMHPLVIAFKSDTVYYPLRVNKLYDGPSDVQFMVLSETRIPDHRFRRIGFFATEQTKLNRGEIWEVWDGLTERSEGWLNFQCFRLVDPRSWYRELHPNAFKREYLLELPKLRRQAFQRWDHDVSVSFISGREYDPTYRQSDWPGH